MVIKNSMDKNILSSLLALETSFILSLIVFFSLINPRFYYSKRVIFVCLCITFFWFVVTVYSIIKGEKKRRITPYFGSLLIYLIVIFYMVRSVWFRSCLTLAPEYSFFNGLCHSDTLYLSGLCEAIKNNGYPALLSQGLAYHKYHYFSIVLLAIISKIVKIPCLITYNFLYPVVFLPLFIYLFFQAIASVREYLNKNKTISISDIIISIWVIVGFLPLHLQNSTSIWWIDIFVSESYCVSLVLLLFYIVLINRIKDIRNGKLLIYNLVTPFFIFIITATKISVGIIFFVFLSWIFIRNEKFKISTVLSLVLGFIILFISTLLFMRDAQNIGNRTFTWFHFIKTYVSKEYIASHLFFIIFPSLLLYFFSKGTQPFSLFYKTKICILSEAAVLSSFCSILPGILYEIEGGSAAYFFLPAIFISLFVLLCSSELQIQLVNISKEKKYIIFLLFLVIYGESFLNGGYKYGTTYVNATPQYMIEQWRQGKRGNRKIINNQFYKSLNKINRLTEGKKQQYCLFVSDDCKIFNLYKKDNYYFVGSRGLLAITAYLGMPVITDLKESKEMKVKNVIILEKNAYRILNLK